MWLLCGITFTDFHRQSVSILITTVIIPFTKLQYVAVTEVTLASKCFVRRLKLSFIFG